MSARVQRADARYKLCGEPCRRVHRHVQRHQVGRRHRAFLERLHGQIKAGDRRAHLAQPGRRRGQTERLAAELVRRDQDDIDAAHD
ncbi:MAG: hypothetical protein M3069_31960 [Chloroflexota bacterium]|nr:hypothetical protein [Chloroflexota bacterium]